MVAASGAPYLSILAAPRRAGRATGKRPSTPGDGAHRQLTEPVAMNCARERYPHRPNATKSELTLADGQPLTIEVTPSLLPIARWLPWVLIGTGASCCWDARGWRYDWPRKPLAQLADAADRIDPSGAGEQCPAGRPVGSRRGPRVRSTPCVARIAAHVAERMQILAAISHDLQTPITRMKLRLEAMDESPRCRNVYYRT